MAYPPNNIKHSPTQPGQRTIFDCPTIFGS
jgi:hypothetical protein